MSNGWMIHAKVIYSFKYRHILILRYVFSRLCDMQNINTLTPDCIYGTFPECLLRGESLFVIVAFPKGVCQTVHFPACLCENKDDPGSAQAHEKARKWRRMERSVSRSLRAAGRSPVGNTRGFDPMAAMTTPPLFSAPNLPHLQTLICVYPPLLLLTSFD